MKDLTAMLFETKAQLIGLRLSGQSAKIRPTLAYYQISKPTYSTRILFRVMIKGVSKKSFTYSYKPEQSCTVNDLALLDRWVKTLKKDYENKGLFARKWK